MTHSILKDPLLCIQQTSCGRPFCALTLQMMLSTRVTNTSVARAVVTIIGSILCMCTWTKCNYTSGHMCLHTIVLTDTNTLRAHLNKLTIYTRNLTYELIQKHKHTHVHSLVNSLTSALGWARKRWHRCKNDPEICYKISRKSRTTSVCSWLCWLEVALEQLVAQ